MRLLKFPWLVISVLFAHVSHGQKDADALLLKDYRPRSIYNIPITTERLNNIPVVDMHSHPYAHTREELQVWVQTLTRFGIEKTIILTGTTGPEFDSLYAIYSAFGDLFEVWCGFDYTGMDTRDWPAPGLNELERCYKQGAKGVGELGDKGYGELYSKPGSGAGIHIDDARLEPLIRRCGELKMPISIHVAEPAWMYQSMDSTNDGLMNAAFWKIDKTKDGFKDHAELLRMLENVVKRNPATTFIACHFANCETNLSVVGKLLASYDNLYADIAARYAETATIPRYMKSFYEKHAGKLLYGTDMGTDASMYQTTFRILESADEHFYETDLFNYHWPCNGFSLKARVLKRLYHGNAERLLKR